MKNQYFADRRDLFKYDLLLDLSEAHGAHRLALLPMLTRPDDSGEGRLTQSDIRGRRPALFAFLKKCLTTGNRDIQMLREFMPTLGVDFMPYHDDCWFQPAKRVEYFAAVPQDYLARSVVFFDPDIGLETGTPGYMRRKGPEKYLMYSDVVNVWARMSSDSIVVVYQHLQNDATKRASDVERRVRDLRNHLDALAWAVQWNDLAFLVASRDQGVASRIRTALQRHAAQHALEFREVAP